MRKLTKSNKVSFSIFILLIILIVIIIIASVIISKKNAKEKVAISANSCVFDKKYNYIELQNDAQIFQDITGNYRLKEDKTNKEYDLGRFAISYDSSKHSLDLFGTFYEVTEGGNVKKISDHNIVKSTTGGSQFYKIGDRKYLIVSNEITSDKSSVSAQNYLIIIMDKAGNALLLNDKVNMKTINNIVLKTDEFEFDIANEKLTFGNEKIDLKKILGSTNEYTNREIQNGNDINNTNETIEVADDENNVVTAGGQDTVKSASGSTYSNVGSGNDEVPTEVSTATSAQPVTQSSTTTGNSNKFVSTLNSWIKSVSTGFQSIYNGSQKTSSSKSGLEKSVHLDSINAGTTYLDVNYSVNDPENKYNVVYLNVGSSSGMESISLNKNETSYRVTNLTPNTNYTVELGYKIIYSDSTNEDVVEDNMIIKTLEPNEELAITRITPTKLYFNLKIDSNYKYDDGCILKMFVNENEGSSGELKLTSDILGTAASTGYVGSFDIPSDFKRGIIEIKLDNTKINGKSVNCGLDSKINY